MGRTKIFVTQDIDVARRTAKAWLVENPDHQGAVVAETDKIVLQDASDPWTDLWASDGGGPWFLILATPDSFASGTGIAARLAGEAPDDSDHGS